MLMLTLPLFITILNTNTFQDYKLLINSNKVHFIYDKYNLL